MREKGRTIVLSVFLDSYCTSWKVYSVVSVVLFIKVNMALNVHRNHKANYSLSIHTANVV